jgi:hypothetical protein
MTRPPSFARAGRPDPTAVAEARDAARAALLGCLVSVKACLGSLDRVARVLKMNGYVRCPRDFSALPQVTDAAASLLIDRSSPTTPL